MSGPGDAQGAERYDAWYRSPRGRWIGETEYRLLAGLLGARRGESVLDVGCGTGYFTRLLAERAGVRIVGLDTDLAWLRYARAHADAAFVAGRAERLPFEDGAFDHAIAVTSLCFVRDQDAALRELVRVTRKRVALGLLNRRSLLYLEKGRGGGKGAYRGAHWHTPAEIRAQLARLPLRDVRLAGAVFLPAGGRVARWLEAALPASFLAGAFLLAVAEVVR
ncbi:MAG: class I SAM-dependent methyltransferase [Burkholderiales bacterium]|nr:class I SAM-dependent methyltransferase [Burkholderiales bacterium]